MCPLLWAAYRGGACAILPLSRLPLPPPPLRACEGPTAGVAHELLRQSL